MDFFWLFPQKIAGGSLPRSHSDIEFLVNNGINQIISLIEDPSSVIGLIDTEVILLHSIPIKDFNLPKHSQIQEFLSILENNLQTNQATFIHCFGGCGRTGTMLALYLIHTGYSAKEAIQKIRAVRPCSIETEEQEQLVRKYRLYKRRFRNSRI